MDNSIKVTPFNSLKSSFKAIERANRTHSRRSPHKSFKVRHVCLRRPCCLDNGIVARKYSIIGRTPSFKQIFIEQAYFLVKNGAPYK